MGDKGSRHSGIQYRKVSTQIYADARFAALSSPKANGKTLWLYLLTGPHTTNIPGLFAVSRETLASNLGWSVKDVTRIWKEFEAVDEGHEYRMVMADWSKSLVFVPKAVAHNGVGSFNAVQGWRAQWNNLVECELKLEAWEAILAGFQAAGNDECAAAFAVCCKRPNLKYTGAFPSRIDGSRHWLNPLFFSQRVVEALGGRGGTIPPTILGSLPPGILPHPVGEPPRDQDQEQDQEQEQEQEKKKEPSAPPAAVAVKDDPFGTPPVLQTQPPATVATTPDRKPRQPKLVLTGEAPSSRKPANPEHAQIVADMGRWLDRYRTWRSDPKATVSFHVFAQAWKARGIDDLMLALHGLREDDFAKSCGPKALLSGDMIAKGVNFARNGTPRTSNHAEGTLQIARAMVGAVRDWTPPEDL